MSRHEDKRNQRSERRPPNPQARPQVLVSKLETKMKMGIIGLGLVAVMAVGAVSAQTTGTTETVAAPRAAETTSAKGWEIAGLRIANPFDSRTWYDASKDLELDQTETVAINFADPDFWMSLPRPVMHSKMHKSFVNPVTWAQFAKVETYTAMMDVNVWKKWLELDSYAVLIEPETYTYRMQPGAYMHAFDARSYAQMVNPAAYGEIADTMLETAGMGFVSDMAKSAVAKVIK